MEFTLDFPHLLETAYLGGFGAIVWYFKIQIDRQMELLAKTHDMVTSLKSEHDTYKQLGKCPLINMAEDPQS